MFERFGEMDSAAEINELAKNLSNEGDTESIYVLAEENGLAREMAQGFIEGEFWDICDEETAAAGKIGVEKEAMKLGGLFEDWTGYIEAEIMGDKEFAIAARRRGKALKDCMAKLLRYSFEHRSPVPQEIIKAANISTGKVDFGVPGMKDAKRIIREYYLGGAR